MKALAWFGGMVLLLLSGCRYTFLPLDPGRPLPPERPFAVARLERDADGAHLVLRIERLPRAGYLHLKWFREEALVQEKVLFLEAPGLYRVAFPLGEGYHRLVGLWEGGALFQLDLGTPRLPDPDEEEKEGLVTAPQNPNISEPGQAHVRLRVGVIVQNLAHGERAG